ncbi:MAG: cysteine--tRNA ligase [Acidiferrobacterales bacterium]|nr:cysteine--tRNA ligase [Acidiferrobacterales bacterium]
MDGNPIRIYNSLTRRKENFVPIRENRIDIYVCGMTVYDYCHLGHARVMVAFDSVIRYFRYRGYKVRYVRNITDIDDKIIKRANEMGESIQSLTDRFIGFMNEDLDALSIVKPDHEPRATQYIPEIIDMISRLVEKGFAYAADNGDVYYRTRMFENYGELSGENVDDLRVGARVEPDEVKEDPIDFVLWKHSKPDEPKWPSPWGDGRPGWHIECSAMSTCLLGDHFDIHGGGRDLLFPHHENEIAQSEGVSGGKFVNLWMHNGYLQINAEKMSKSLENFLTIREILDQDRDRIRIGEILRYVFLSSHYRSPLNYSDDSLKNARLALRRIYMAIHKTEEIDIPAVAETDSRLCARFRAAMDDDFNTPDGLAVIFDCVRELNRAVKSDSLDRIGVLKNTLMELAGSLGLANMEPSRFLGVGGAFDDADDGIGQLVMQREAARRERDFATADRIRAQLTEIGVEIEDRPDGTTVWRRA